MQINTVNYAHTRLNFLRDIGFHPKTIIDGGAWHGDWNRMIKSIFSDARVLSIEANTECAAYLNGLEYEIALLGDKDGKTVPYYTTRCGSDTGNSIFLEQTVYFSKNFLSVRELPMTTLDTVCQSRGITAVDFLKLDVQGAELVVLDGSRELLKTAEFVLLEVSILQYNAGAPLMADVTRYMDEAGFQMFDILETHFYGQYLNQIDILYVKKGSRYIPTLSRDASLQSPK
jgi:FkbM family methyltransferase